MTQANQLLTQTEARQEARRTNQEGLPEGLVAVAHPVPLGCWGGTEDGWSVSYVPVKP